MLLLYELLIVFGGMMTFIGGAKGCGDGHYDAELRKICYDDPANVAKEYCYYSEICTLNDVTDVTYPYGFWDLTAKHVNKNSEVEFDTRCCICSDISFMRQKCKQLNKYVSECPHTLLDTTTGDYRCLDCPSGKVESYVRVYNFVKNIVF
jgi:hypothetical protein